ncbi:MAG: methylated-DNA--[protein]-cysteine S-methyltransferase [Gordonia sp. (in: high G+C Gram-positive bacteria)]|uniref:methylated-DNA--[protein]-cysteine S-methyltransferase n=1 Tax=Gordonia sp. (in: high G+C Gram-positive bacteria) TaxID=84139 RepID=UPI003BB6B6F5
MSDTTTARPVRLGWATVATPDGPFTALFDDKGTVYASGWTSERDYLAALIHPSLTPDKLVNRPGTRVTHAVRDYYLGDLAAPATIAVHQLGGPFITAAWAALRQVPPGPPVTYTELAERAGNAAAVRGAAACCSRNAAALFVPCHRVVRSNGGLGGFRYGLDRKAALIDRECGF